MVISIVMLVYQRVTESYTLIGEFKQQNIWDLMRNTWEYH